jgi:indolepyruvate ferredoxin oxidoreductase beta subunit
VLLRADAIDPGTLPTAKALNVAVLGMLSVHLPMKNDVWTEAIRAGLPEKLHDVNLQAFRAGQAAARKEKSR